MKRPTTPQHAASYQHGAVLITTLILLVALTLLGVSVMNTSQMEERMASNAQEVVQSFQSAETGLSEAYVDKDSWNPIKKLKMNDPPYVIVSDIGRKDEIQYQSEHVVDTNPPPGYDVVQFRAAHFDFRSEGKSESGLESVVHGGGLQVMRRFGN